MPSVAALVIGLPSRKMIDIALDSVYAQTRQPDEIIWNLDHDGVGETANMNGLINRTDCEWVAHLHDDDRWHDNHLEAAEPFMTDEYDVIVSNFKSVGRPQATFEKYHENWVDFKFTNWTWPGAIIARKSVLRYWDDARRPTDDPWFDQKDLSRLHSNNAYQDWTTFRRLQHEGARFVRTRRTTVDYCFGDWDNGSWTGEQSAAAGQGDQLDTLMNLSRLLNG